MADSKHGLYRTPVYNSWANMKARCSKPEFTNYHGRGIKYCPEWADFQQFYADMGDRPEGTSLDRIDSNGNYCPENCKWSTRKEQSNNMRSNILHEGKTIKQICEERGLNHKLIYDRIRKGWSIEEAITLPRYRRRQ